MHSFHVLIRLLPSNRTGDHLKSILIFRNDLRTHDNETLATALEQSDSVLLLYILEERLLGSTQHGSRKLGTHRARFLLESLLDLKETILSKGGRILFAKGDYPTVITPLLSELSIGRVFLTQEYTQEEIDSVQSIISLVPVTQVHNLTAFRPTDIPYDSPELIPNQFSAFRRKTENRSTVSPHIDTPSELTKTDFPIDTGRFPQLTDDPRLLFTSVPIAPPSPPQSAFPFKGGETHALARLEDYIFTSRLVETYETTRNGLVGSEYSTKLSPWLANGSLSARYAFNMVLAYESQHPDTDSPYKIRFELMWRDYFKYLAIKQQSRIFFLSGLKSDPPSFAKDFQTFEAWKRGETADQFINANMVELAETGWMSNRGRQVVASYLTKDLGIDWRLGAEHFEEMLIDYDPASNYCNWQYQSGVGVDSRPFRKFNPVLQAKKFDPDGAYRKMWLGDRFQPDTLL